MTSAGNETTGASAAARCWRVLSLAVAGFISLLLMIDPYVLRGISDARIHAGLPLVMLGVSGLFMHGLGLYARTKAWRIACHPVTAWLLLTAGVLVVTDFA
jgi:predicted membrane protein